MFILFIPNSVIPSTRLTLSSCFITLSPYSREFLVRYMIVIHKCLIQYSYQKYYFFLVWNR